MKKRLLSGLLMCCMVLTMLPTTAFAATQNYNLWIGGERVTSDNLSGDGWKFEPETNTLVLNGFGLATWGYNMGTDFLGRYPKNVNMFAIIYAEGKMDRPSVRRVSQAISATPILQTGHMKRASGRTPPFITPAEK